jgi:hypothetical protein
MRSSAPPAPKFDASAPQPDAEGEQGAPEADAPPAGDQAPAEQGGAATPKRTPTKLAATKAAAQPAASGPSLIPRPPAASPRGARSAAAGPAGAEGGRPSTPRPTKTSASGQHTALAAGRQPSRSPAQPGKSPAQPVAEGEAGGAGADGQQFASWLAATGAQLHSPMPQGRAAHPPAAGALPDLGAAAQQLPQEDGPAPKSDRKDALQGALQSPLRGSKRLSRSPAGARACCPAARLHGSCTGTHRCLQPAAQALPAPPPSAPASALAWRGRMTGTASTWAPPCSRRR